MLPICTADRLVEISVTQEGRLEAIFNIQTVRAKFLLNEIDNHKIDHWDHVCIKDLIEEHTGIKLTVSNVERLCQVFPQIVAEVAINGVDTLVKEEILNCLSMLLVGTNFKDCLELKEMLISQADRIFGDGFMP